MRIILAFIITVIIYTLLIMAYLFYFKSVKITHKAKDEHIIKIDIRDISRYVEKIDSKTVKQKPKREIKKQKVKKQKSKKIVKKKAIKKKKVIKTVESEALAPKKIKTPKKVDIKPPIFIEKDTVEYIPEIIEVEEVSIEEPVYEEYIQEEPIQEDILDEYYTSEPIVEESVVPPKPNDIIAEEDMLYIPNPISNQPTTTSLSSLLGEGSSYDISSPPKSPMIQKLYGTSFDSFTPIQKKFIVDNLGSIHHITQRTLTRRGYPAGAVAMRTAQEGENIVSFDLHPNGDISNLILEKKVGYRALDENTLQTIRIAYKDYPYPTETTHIIFYVEYSIFGY